MTALNIDFMSYPLVLITGKSLLARHLYQQYGYQVADEDDRFAYEENCGLGTWVPLHKGTGPSCRTADAARSPGRNSQ